MRSGYSISILVFVVFMVLCLSGSGIPVGGGFVKYSQVGFLIFCLFNPYILNCFSTTRIVDKWANISLLVLLFFCFFSLTYSVNSDKTLIQAIQLLLNVLIFYYVVGFLMVGHNALLMIPFLQFTFYIIVFLSFLEYLGIIVFPTSEYGGGGFLGGIKPGLFLHDSNWTSTYVFFLYFTLYLYHVKGYIQRKNMNFTVVLMVFYLLLTLSRVVILAFVIHFLFEYTRFLRKKWLIPFFIIGYLFVLSPIPRMFLPERYTNDIYDDSSNPRYLDSFFLVQEVKNYSRELSGFGFGTLSYVNDDIRFSGRGFDFEYNVSINVLPAQVYFDFGLLGLIVLGMLLIILFIRAGTWNRRFIIISSFVFCCFHMPGYMNFFWLFLGYFYYLFNLLNLKSI